MLKELRSFGVERIGFAAATVLGGVIFWLSSHLPMADLVQHAAQIALFRDLILGTSQWSSLVYVNLFTPYLLGYGATFLLSLLMPLTMAIATLLTLSYWVSIAFLVLLRKKLGGDERLDWLFIPGFFGFAFIWGFYSFLLAEPLALIVIYVALGYTRNPRFYTGLLLVLVDVLLFFSHGLAFLFANAVAGAFLLVEFRSWSRLAIASVPLVLSALLCAVFVFGHVPRESAASGTFLDIHFGWRLSRLGYLLFFPAGNPNDWLFAPLRLLLVLGPFLLESRLNRKEPAAWAPFIVLLAVWLVVPNAAMNTIYLYQRFDVFVLPFYAFLFRKPGPPETANATGPRRISLLWLPALCCLFLAIQMQRVIAFGKENADFDEVVAVAKPGYRALSLILDNTSPAAVNTIAYNSFALWYQALKKGLVDYNFSMTHTAVVRYRREHEPPDLTQAGWSADKFRWEQSMPGPYRYYFVRHTAPLPAGYSLSGPCAPTLLKTVGAWSIYENRNCYTESPASG